MATAETIRDQLAFMAEFGQWARGCRWDTKFEACRQGLARYTSAAELEASGFKTFDVATEQGLEVAATSPLAKCFAWLKEQGFERATWQTRKPSGNFIAYTKRDDDGTELASAFISSWDRVYVRRRGTTAELEFNGRTGGAN